MSQEIWADKIEDEGNRLVITHGASRIKTIIHKPKEQSATKDAPSLLECEHDLKKVCLIRGKYSLFQCKKCKTVIYAEEMGN